MRKAYALLSVALLIYFFPFIIFGKFTVVPVLDNLDSYIVWNKIAASHYTWSPPATLVKEFMNGLPKFTLTNCFSLFYLLNIFFSSFYAVLIHMILIHSIACFSMFLLAKKYLTNSDQPGVNRSGGNVNVNVNVNAAIIAAIAFGIQPQIYAYSLSISLIPLLVLTFINFYQQRISLKDWLLIIMYPFVSNFLSVGIFILLAWIVISVFLFYRKKIAIIKLLLAPVIMIILYYLNNYATVNNLLFGKYFNSHRAEFKYIPEPVFSDFSTGFYIKIFLVLLACYVLYNMYKVRHALFNLLLALLLMRGIYFLIKLIMNVPLVVEIQQKIPLMRMYHFDKILFPMPLIYVSILAICLSYFFERLKEKNFQAVLVFAAVIFLPLISLQWKQVLGFEWSNTGRPFLGYYSPDLFEKIRQSIPLPPAEYKVASFGIQPAAALYNGLYTVDGYINNYPIEYKNKFYNVIKQDVDSIKKDFGLRNWDFITTGHHCCLTNISVVENSDGIMPVDKINPLPSPQIVHWDLNELKELGCSYIISSVEISFQGQDAPVPVDQFENKFYKLFLYKLP